jgi:uncharacterized protein with HEPN domain
MVNQCTTTIETSPAIYYAMSTIGEAIARLPQEKHK